jgi:NAD(P)-dependent dehydrogenase (short-subunit alcohol dehydrogenase family)
MDVYKTNLVGPVNITRAVLPHFRASKAGVVVFMGSQSGWFGDAWAAAYCASKFALEGLSFVCILCLSLS